MGLLQSNNLGVGSPDRTAAAHVTKRGGRTAQSVPESARRGPAAAVDIAEAASDNGTNAIVEDRKHALYPSGECQRRLS
jgi:hypothetical protein